MQLLASLISATLEAVPKWGDPVSLSPSLH